MVALKASWQVLAGLIPGIPLHEHAMPEYTKSWYYSFEDYEKDGNERGGVYAKMAYDAHRYARDLEEGGLNFVEVQYIWL